MDLTALPSEIKVLIFKYLDESSLKSCSLVSKDFRNLIFNFSFLMRNFPLIVCEESALSKLEFMKSHGKLIKSVIVKDHAYYLLDLLIFMPNIVELVINDQSFHYQVNQQLMRIIELSVNDEKKKIEEIKYENEESEITKSAVEEGNFIDKLIYHSSEEKLPKFNNKLKSNSIIEPELLVKRLKLTVDSSESSSMRLSHDSTIFINLPHLTHLTIESNNRFVVKNILDRIYNFKNLLSFNFLFKNLDFHQHWMIIKKFLSQLKHLRELKLASLNLNDEIFKDFNQMPFKLKKLTLGYEWEGRRNSSTDDFINFYSFLAHQSENLIEFNFGHCGVCDKITGRKTHKLVEWMLSRNDLKFDILEKFHELNFRNLRKLRFWNIDYISKNSNYLYETDLTHDDKFNSLDGWQNFSNNHNNVHHLYIRCYDDRKDEIFFNFFNDNISQIFEYFVHLKEIKISTYGYVIMSFKRPNNVNLYSLNYESCKFRIESLKSIFKSAEIEIINENKFEELLTV